MTSMYYRWGEGIPRHGTEGETMNSKRALSKGLSHKISQNAIGRQGNREISSTVRVYMNTIHISCFRMEALQLETLQYI